MRKKKAKKQRILGFFAFLLVLGFVFAGIFALWVSSLPLPDFGSFEQRKIAESTKIYDRTGEVILFDVHRDIKRTLVPLDEISIDIRNATIAIEDSEFYDHRGVKPTAILRAFLTNLVSGEVRGQGGSTITQQVIKLTLLTKEKKYSRKIKEAVLALKLEGVMSKEDILTIYLNESPYGGSVYGIEEASMTFFGKQAKDVDLAEAAYLAALPQAPTYYSPYGENLEKLENRKDLVLDRMVALGFTTKEEADKAKNKEVVFSPPTDGGIKAPHFVMFIRQYLEEKYGRDVIETQGLKVITTLDWELQQKAEEIVSRFAEENSEKFNANNAGMVAIDPKTGGILVMVGSRDYFDSENDGNFNITLGYRQPGSAFKPFVYSTAFKKGYTPETVLFDVKTQFSTLCDAYGKPLGSASQNDCYTPKNYDLVYRGPLTIKEALAQSVNIPAVKTLYLVGLRDSLETSRDMGITTLNDINRYGLTLVLGGGEVTLLEMTSAYGVFANNGLRNPYEKILKIEDRQGDVLEEFSFKTKKVLDENIALQITDILSDNEARSPAFGHNSPLYFPGYDVAAKTGTTNDYRDAWIIGYSTDIVVGAWAGNNDNTSMEKRVAGFVVAPMWNEFMREVLQNTKTGSFIKPEKEPDFEKLKPVLRGVWGGSKSYYIDTISGKLATEYTPDETKEERFLTQIHNILYWVDKDDPRGEIPKKPEGQTQFYLWEKGVEDWKNTKGIVETNEDSIPNEYDDVHKPEFSPVITINSPTENISYKKNSKVNINVSVVGKYPITRVEFFFDDTYLGSASNNTFIFSFKPSDVLVSDDGVADLSGIVKVRAYDSVKNSSEESVEIKFNDFI